MPTQPIKIAFALEYSLGHITHSDNLKHFLKDAPDVNPVYIDIPYDSTPMPAWLKPVLKNNWSVRASSAARKGIKAAGKCDAYFFHTQITSLFSSDLMKKTPTIISLDATPLQYDALGEFYKHQPGPKILENLKRDINTKAFNSAVHLVTWSEWAKKSLVSDYGQQADKITVILPGIDSKLWSVERDDCRFDQIKNGLTLLFVGGDFERKGGSILLEAFRRLYADDNKVKLLIATKTLAAGNPEPGVFVYNGLTPNSDGLRALYAKADIFAFPTLGDCLPLAVMEALAAGLPVVSSSVGAIGEAVIDGKCGYLVPPGDSNAFYKSLKNVHDNIESIKSLSEEAQTQARCKFDSTKNYNQLISLIKSSAARN